MPRRNFTTANVVSNYYFFTDKNRFFRRVYNEGPDTERAPSRFDLAADPLSLSRALIVKYSHTFTF